MKNKYEVILFYKYVTVRSPLKLRADQIALATKLGLKGRVIVAAEGINGTLEGTTGAVKKYISEVRKDKRFQDVVFKKTEGNGTAFPRLSIKVRPEIVTLGQKVTRKHRGKYLAPRELRSWYKNKKDITVIDMRNVYETRVGHFENSVLPPMQHFRDLAKVLPKLEKYKNKTVVTVCTGGIRCEKASGYLKQNGFKDVYQLEGGIATYMKQYPGKDFEGSLYVFDNRILTRTAPDVKVVGKCSRCGKAEERYVNCAHETCHVHFILCLKCEKRLGAYCSQKCQKESTFAVV